MGNYEELKAAVAAVIKQNGNEEITGQIMQNTLLSMISNIGANSTFAGVATPETAPGTPDQNIFYIASEPGVYANFGGYELIDGIVVFSNKSGEFTAELFNLDAIKRLFIADASFSGIPTIDKNHICNIGADGTINYRIANDYDCGWIKIFDGSTRLEITGGNQSRVIFFNDINPTTETFISASLLSNPAIPNGARYALINFPKANNPGGYLDLRVAQSGMGETKKAVDENKVVSNSFSGYVDIYLNKGFGISESGDYTGYNNSTILDSAQVIVYQGSKHLEVKGANPSMFAYFSDVSFSAETFLGNNRTGEILPGSRYALINFLKANNPGGYLDLTIRQDLSGAYRNEVDKIINDVLTIRPAGKNYLNPVENLVGYSLTVSSEGVLSIRVDDNGIMSNKLLLDNGKIYAISPDIIPNPASDYVYLMHFDKNDNVLGNDWQRFLISTATPVKAKLPANYAYSRLSLKNVAASVYNPDTAQLELGEISTDFEEYKGEKYYVANIDQEKEGYRPSMMLFGNSVAFPKNTWFLDACRMLGVTGYNRALSGQLIYQFANLYKDRTPEQPYGRVFTKEEFNEFDVLVLSYSNTLPVHMEENLREKVEDYDDFTFVSNTDWSMAWDYVLKRYRKDCYDAKFDPESKWYNSQEGKPCYIIVCTWPVDSRTTYNKSIRKLQKKWGFALMNFDENALFYSKVPMEELIQPTGSPNYPASYMTPVLHSNFAKNPSEGQNNVVNMWHQSTLTNAPIQKRMALQFYSFVLSGLRSIYPEPDTQKVTGQFYTIKGYAIRASDGVAIEDGGDWWCTDFLPLNKMQDLIVDGYQDTLGTRTFCAFYDVNKNYLGCIQNIGIGQTWNSSSNTWITDYLVKKEQFNSGGEFENAFYIRCSDLSRRGEIKNISIQYLLDKLIKLCEATNIDFTTL